MSALRLSSHLARFLVLVAPLVVTACSGGNSELDLDEKVGRAFGLGFGALVVSGFAAWALVAARSAVKRARVRRHGQLADATVVSVRIQHRTDENGAQLDEADCWIIYDVYPPNQPPFRERGSERMDDIQAKANHIEPGGKVRVRVSQDRKTVILERVPSSSRKEQRVQEMVKAHARERELLRRPPRPRPKD